MFGPPEADNAYVREGEWLAPNPNRPIEHGPAHVHVIERHSGRESKFLMVADKYGEHYAVAMPPTKNRLPLGRKQELACEELLRPYVPHFIQLWQEMYADNDMSACVARTEENHNGALEVQGAHGHSFVKRALLRRAAFGLEKAYG
ncbi:MAG: hypothetical protein EBV03_00850 [Proteobacteria bacterium]|nr:hypothetical protein [Pseudomonadota bacterium]